MALPLQEIRKRYARRDTLLQEIRKLFDFYEYVSMRSDKQTLDVVQMHI